MIKWNQYTWYSKLAAAIFFIFILPVWAFYIGAQYEKTKDIVNDNKAVSSIVVPVENQAAIVTGVYKSDDDGVLTISKGGNGTFHINGSAYWDNPNTGQPNVGSIDGDLKIYGNTGTYDDGDCLVEITFGKNQLSAKDNLSCGGFNVSFTGDYIKQQ